VNEFQTSARLMSAFIAGIFGFARKLPASFLWWCKLEDAGEYSGACPVAQ
jgi:hypothetical protein